jgi:hypothetical protein
MMSSSSPLAEKSLEKTAAMFGFSLGDAGAHNG